MQIVKIMGGLGNQMFQYAFLKSLILRNRNELDDAYLNVKVDLSWFDTSNDHNGYELDRVFNIKVPIATENECQRNGKPDNSSFTKIALKLSKYDICKELVYSILDKHYCKYTEPLQGIAYYPDIYKYQNCYYDGYWQNYCYFKRYLNDILDEFVFVKELDDKNLKIKNAMENSNSVSIHVRRGDFLKFSIYQGVCSLNYYQAAIRQVEAKIKKPTYFVFSDDIRWCKDNLQLENCIYVEGNNQLDSYKDMQLMSCCKNNIIANSTFSLWGALLNKNTNKIVIAPNKVFSIPDAYYNDALPSNWIQVKV